MKTTLDTYVFYSNERILIDCIEAGVNGVIIDWEKGDKQKRQKQYNTQINSHGIYELDVARKLYQGTIICRINGGELISEAEIKEAIDHGASEILLPMITNLKQLDTVFSISKDLINVSVMIETPEAILLAIEISKYDLSKVYVGLNDLAICKGEKNIFLPVIDGTIEKIRPFFTCDFGFAGLTHPNLGSPVPSISLLREMKRLKCDFSFLRRSFFKDLELYSASEILNSIAFEFKTNGYNINEQKNILGQQIRNLDCSLI